MRSPREAVTYIQPVEFYAKPHQIEFQAGQGLSELVVQLPCNSAPFLFCGYLHPASLAA